MIRLNPAGKIIWANRQYFEITGHPQGDHYEFSFLEPVHTDDREGTAAFWDDLSNELEPVSQEIRLHRYLDTSGYCWQPASERRILLAHGECLSGPRGRKLGSIVCCVTDVSRNKWAE